MKHIIVPSTVFFFMCSFFAHGSHFDDSVINLKQFVSPFFYRSFYATKNEGKTKSILNFYIPIFLCFFSVKMILGTIFLFFDKDWKFINGFFCCLSVSLNHFKTKLIWNFERNDVILKPQLICVVKSIQCMDISRRLKSRTYFAHNKSKWLIFNTVLVSFFRQRPWASHAWQTALQ